MAYVQLTNRQMVYLFMSVCMFLSIFNISLHKDISFFDQKANVWLIYVCIHVLRIFNISHHTGISSIDQKADGLLIMSVFMFQSILTFHSIMASVQLTNRHMFDLFMSVFLFWVF